MILQITRQPFAAQLAFHSHFSISSLQVLLPGHCTSFCLFLWKLSAHVSCLQVGNEIGQSDPEFMRKHGDELKKDTGKWIDSSVWHGKAHTWEKIPWLIKEVGPIYLSTDQELILCSVEANFERPTIPFERNSKC